MTDEFILGVGQAHNLEQSFRRTGWDTAEIHKLGEGETLRDVREVVRGFSEIKPTTYEVHPQVNPKVPEGMLLKMHVPNILDPVVHLYRQNDELFLNERKILLKELEVDPARRFVPTFNVLLDELHGVNATVMQALEQMPKGFIPWPEHICYVFFPGSIFFGSYLPDEAATDFIGCLRHKASSMLGPSKWDPWVSEYYSGKGVGHPWDAHFSRIAVLERL